MSRWIRSFWQANRQTQYFILVWALFGLAIVASTAYCYGRLDFVRSGPKETTTQQT